MYSQLIFADLALVPDHTSKKSVQGSMPILLLSYTGPIRDDFINFGLIRWFSRHAMCHLKRHKLSNQLWNLDIHIALGTTASAVDEAKPWEKLDWSAKNVLIWRRLFNYGWGGPYSPLAWLSHSLIAYWRVFDFWETIMKKFTLRRLAAYESSGRVKNNWKRFGDFYYRFLY